MTTAMNENTDLDALEPCPFCTSTNVDPEGWASHNPETGVSRTGPACDDCGGSADTVELWNTRPAFEAIARQQEGLQAEHAEMKRELYGDPAESITSVSYEVRRGETPEQAFKRAAHAELARARKYIGDLQAERDALKDRLANPPKHDFWRPGEPDCPKEIKAGNGELHTLRCKRCGLDSPRSEICGVPDDINWKAEWEATSLLRIADAHKITDLQAQRDELKAENERLKAERAGWEGRVTIMERNCADWQLQVKTIKAALSRATDALREAAPLIEEAKTALGPFCVRSAKKPTSSAAVTAIWKLKTALDMIRAVFTRVDKIIPRRARQAAWLEKVRRAQDEPNWCRGLPLHISGGFAFDRDLRDLVRRGLLRMDRDAYTGLATWKHGYMLSRSVLRITDAGRAALASKG